MKSKKNINYQLIIGVVIIIATAVFAFNKFQELSTVKTNIVALQNTSKDIQKTTAQGEKTYGEIKKNMNSVSTVAAEKFNAILPNNTDSTRLVRLFDDFQAKHHYSNNPFFVNSVSYGNTKKHERSGLEYVPVTVSITSSESNLLKWLNFIENSGSENRLMEINKINVQLPKADAKENAFSYQIELRAYYYNQDING